MTEETDRLIHLGGTQKLPFVLPPLIKVENTNISTHLNDIFKQYKKEIQEVFPKIISNLEYLLSSDAVISQFKKDLYVFFTSHPQIGENNYVDTYLKNSKELALLIYQIRVKE
ncbi:hypothetical protein E0W68_10325 [Flavobacterium salilacus subsp. salilacus]|uniref:hypothetical protein n=1 Tax=Flavobacterium TaxID=237 RepID=UPI001074FE13|nr:MULTISPECIES: hypothetical protein [Flavobacterium]KAF2518125.1 hypothetical protein E0W68_10325 [Flavobacterium salilacus subsp. salilacus]MBE1615565.1 hypothetical protein [Flavobacterium sp. SaA2.13]